MNRAIFIFLISCSSTKIAFSTANPDEFQPVPIAFITKQEKRDTIIEEKSSEYTWKAEAIKGAFVYGYRIQVLATSNKNQVEKLKDEIIKKGVNYPVYIKYVPPMYRLRIGDFKNYEEAQKALNQIKNLGYKDAFIIEDFINK
ncbi:MAG: SPOR domain-containing protein [candidate division WOR-3 bacterium]